MYPIIQISIGQRNFDGAKPDSNCDLVGIVNDGANPSASTDVGVQLAKQRTYRSIRHAITMGQCNPGGR
jgi:hypothetical protein